MEQMALYLNVVLILVFVAGNAFFVASEIALTSARRSRIKQLADTGNRSARIVQILHGQPERFYSVTQIGITMVSMGLGAIGIITEVKLKVVPMFELRQFVFDSVSFADVVTDFKSLMSSAYSVSLFTTWDDSSQFQIWIKTTEGSYVPNFEGTLATAPRHPVPGMPVAVGRIEVVTAVDQAELVAVPVGHPPAPIRRRARPAFPARRVFPVAAPAAGRSGRIAVVVVAVVVRSGDTGRRQRQQREADHRVPSNVHHCPPRASSHARATDGVARGLTAGPDARAGRSCTIHARGAGV